MPGGSSPGDAVEIARALKAHHCDIVDVSAGQTVPEQQPVYGRLFQTPFADRVRHEAAIPTMTVGNISSYADVNSILVAGRADLCVLARAHLFDPYWTRHAAYEQGYALPWPDQYNALARYTPRFKCDKPAAYGRPYPFRAACAGQPSGFIESGLAASARADMFRGFGSDRDRRQGPHHRAYARVAPRQGGGILAPGRRRP
jgi:hypothetical protein